MMHMEMSAGRGGVLREFRTVLSSKRGREDEMGEGGIGRCAATDTGLRRQSLYRRVVVVVQESTMFVICLVKPISTL